MTEVKPHRVADIIGLVCVIGSLIFVGLYRAMFHIWSNAHRQHLNGTIDPAVFASVVQELTAYSGTVPEGANIADIQRRQNLTRWAWQSERFLYNPDLQRFVDTALGLGVQAKARD